MPTPDTAKPDARTIMLRVVLPFVVVVLVVVAAVVLAALKVLTETNATRLVAGSLGAALYLAGAAPKSGPGDGPPVAGAGAAALLSLLASEGAAAFMHGGQ